MSRIILDMLFKWKRQYSWLIVLWLISALFLSGTACLISEMPAEVNNPPVDQTATDNMAYPPLLNIESFAAVPKTIALGEGTVLSWKVAGASSLSIDPNIGNVSGDSGNVSISPQETTLYTLRASDRRYEISAKFLIIVKTADGTIIWPKSISDNITIESLYEGWSYYPNKYVVWDIIDRNKDTATDTVNCWHQGRIINNHTEWIMTDVTVNNRLVANNIVPSQQLIYVTSMDCMQFPELKWKWKVYP